ncbi:MAG TPA: GNAT family N-acetyltransferase [candidate division Zixibacteria bacterium]|nr:GNAT family N-acetyltransferase [candidate division Zixibacteria bacterium]MDD4918631.1 GNAT family N-acetyltransferase [candidate division Zixibacteria bacterium]MDM7972001.1 GNAT family N-acetyltransferase [candidate division Zixibacteria bacterium]HOD66062.1 GNAT family N-acetyltransferase [candidate division Zixibacteria bacterium]HPM38455.1 GNAT family N-acetyltransferase [candidate division Zixibacteria bacterium]
MATEIREIEDRDLDAFIRLQIDAYPGLGMIYERDREKLRQRIAERRQDVRVTLYGSYRGNRLVGCMRVHDYRMNFRGALVAAGGLGGVAVDLTVKREGVAGGMVRFYLDKYAAAGAPMAVLWPFRPDFYRKMGFGYGGKKYRYTILPETLPHAAGKGHLAHGEERDFAAMTRCHNRLLALRTGMLDETELSLRQTVGAAGGGRAVVYRDGREVRGFMVYRFRPGAPGNFVSNDLCVEECLYESPEVLAEFLAFLHSQRDQVRRVILDLPDPNFHYAPVDPRNGSEGLYASVYHEVAACAVGPMYRVLDVQSLLAAASEAKFGPGEATVAFTLADRWWGKTAGTTAIHFCEGRAAAAPKRKCDVAVEMEVADFSSVILGAVRLSQLVDYGLARVSKRKSAEVVDSILAAAQPPYCFSRF